MVMAIAIQTADDTRFASQTSSVSILTSAGTWLFLAKLNVAFDLTIEGSTIRGVGDPYP